MNAVPRTLYVLVILVILIALPTSARAQYQYAGEVFGGYSYLDFKPGEELPSAGLHGWNASFAGFVNNWLGVAADVSQHFGSTELPPNIGGIAEVDVEQWSYLFGPQIRPLRRERFSASFRALFGASTGDADPDTFVVPGPPLRLSIKETKFAAAFGGALDMNLTRRIAWRLQPDFFLTTFSGREQKNFRFSTGIIFRFGERY